MSDKVRQMTNSVKLSGKVAELEITEGVTKAKVPYVNVKGTIQFGENKASSRNFQKFAQEYSIKEDGSHKENKNYSKILDWAKNAKSIAKVGYEEATEVTIQGSFVTNDYVNRENNLVESLAIDASFFNEFKGEAYEGIADIEGYISSIVPETKGEDKDETGRLRVTVLSNDFFGNLIPVKNIIVPEELREVFEDNYEVGQTAKLFITYILHVGETKPVVSGGIGTQRVTEGASYVEMILTGADPAIDSDDERAFSKEAVKIASAERKAKLEELKEKGYQGGNTSKSTANTASTPKTNVSIPDDDLPF